jgi:hypothetical protein
VKIWEADGPKVHVYRAGKVLFAWRGAGEGILGGLMI